MEKIARYTLIATMIVVAIYALATPAKADGFFVESQVNQNLDSSTDYFRREAGGGIVPIEGLATLSIGYAVKLNSAIKVAFGVSHYSNPWTGNDYGGNGLFIKGCFGKGC
jgi:hypothetical protein